MFHQVELAVRVGEDSTLLLSQSFSNFRRWLHLWDNIGEIAEGGGTGSSFFIIHAPEPLSN